MKKKDIKSREIDFSKIDGYAITTWEIIKENLNQLRKDPISCLYRGIDAEKIAFLKKTGQDNNEASIFCSTYDDIERSENGESYENAIKYAEQYLKPALVVYDSEKLTHINGYEYQFKGKTPEEKLEAIVELFVFKYNNKNNKNNNKNNKKR